MSTIFIQDKDFDNDLELLSCLSSSSKEFNYNDDYNVDKEKKEEEDKLELLKIIDEEEENKLITLFERIGKRKDYIYNWYYYDEELKKYMKNTNLKIYNDVTKIHPYKINNIRVSYSGNLKNIYLNIDDDKKNKRGLFYKKKTKDRLLAGYLGVKQNEILPNELDKKDKKDKDNEFIFFRECYWHLTYHPDKEYKNKKNFNKRVRLHFDFHDFNTLDYSSSVNNNPFQITFNFFDGLEDFEEIEDIDKLNLFEIFKKICKINIDTTITLNINNINYLFHLVINIDTPEIFLEITNESNPSQSIKFYPYLTTNYPGNILTYQLNNKYNLYSIIINTSNHIYYTYPKVYLYTPSNQSYINNFNYMLKLIDNIKFNNIISNYNFIKCKLIDNQFILQNI